MDGDQSPVISDTDMMDCLNLDGYGDVEDPHKEGAKGERQPSGKVDELQYFVDTEYQLPVVYQWGNHKWMVISHLLSQILI